MRPVQEEASDGAAASLGVRWVQGFPKKNVAFVNNNTICYPCGNYIIFVDIDTKEKTVLQCMNGSVGAVATSFASEVVAFSDRRLKPNIYIYSFPGLIKKKKLKGNAQLDYSLLAFSNCGIYLASYSSVPEFELSLWDWEENVILCKKSQPDVAVNQMTFNPMNWSQLCLSGGSALTVWHIERINTEHHLMPKPVKLPAADGTFLGENNGLFSGSEPKDAFYGPVLPVSAIAGLVGVEAETFKPKDDFHPLVQPIFHCWTTTNELYVSCEGDHLLLVNAETVKVTVLKCMPLQTSPERKLTVKFSSKLQSSMADLKKGTHSKTPSMASMAFHKDGLLVTRNDGLLYSLDIKGSTYKISNSCDVSEPIRNILFSPNCKRLLIETVKGSIFTCTPMDMANIDTVLDVCQGDFVANDFITPGNKYCLSITITGEGYIWLLEDGSCVSRFSLYTTVADMACCPSSLSAAVGATSGHIHFIDVSTVEFPRVVYRVFPSPSPLQYVHYDQGGLYLITVSQDGHIFILNSKPSKLFQILGCTVISGEIQQLSTVYHKETNLVDVIVLIGLPDGERCKLEMFSLSEEILTDSANWVNERGILKNELIHMHQYEINHSLSSAVLALERKLIYGYCRKVPFICTYPLLEENNKNATNIFLEKKLQSRQFGTGKLYLSPHGRWLASIAKDGILCIRDALTLETFARVRCHSYHGQGIRALTFSMDGQTILASGMDDGALVCLKWKKIGESRINEATEYYGSRLLILDASISKETSTLKEMEEWSLLSQSDSASDQPTEETMKSQSLELISVEEPSSSMNVKVEIPWLQKKTNEAIQTETQKFSGKKKELKKGIKQLSKRIQEMMQENELVSDIAKLEQQEFSLDTEERKRLHAQSEKEVQTIRKEAEMENLAKCYLREVIKEECWDSMFVKGRALRCFHVDCEVQNYPMKERTEKEMRDLETVLHQKKIESTDFKLRKEIVEIQPQVASAKDDDEEEEELEETSRKESKVPNFLLGSLSSEYGVDTSLLYSQLELHTREEKINQIILLKDIIYKVKTNFNTEFNAVYRQKEVEILRVTERNTRMQEIISDLGLSEDIWQPTFADSEKPERVLTVEDEEIKVEKYLSPAQRAKVELMERLELERRLAAQGDDARKRALMDMMGGVLEVKKEDILKMEIPQPAFMAKAESLWNEEEKKQFKEYEKKVKELNEEREKYKKALESELKKLQNSVQESTQAFDEMLKLLFKKKVKSEMVINQEEFKITNLVFSLLLDEELNTRELALNNYLERKHEEKVRSAEAVQMAKKQVDAFRETYDNLVAEDKVLERGFRKEFSEIPSHQVDILYKLFKRRTRIQKPRVQIESTVPFGDRPASVKANKEVFAQITKVMDDLDNPDNMPDNLDPAVWKQFCMIRRMKVENEHQIKWKAANLMEMQAFLQRRIEEDEKVRLDMEKIGRELNILREEKMKFQLDLTIHLLLKQGQVELENFQLMLEYPDSILINRSIIEELNRVIRAQGQKKIASMVESKDFHKGIFQIEWEHKKMEMEMEDLNQKAWDIQMLYFSKDRQTYLNEPNYDSLIAHQISIMEQTLAVLDKTHKKDVSARKKILKELGRYSTIKDVINYNLSYDLQEELVSVSERRLIYNTIGTELPSEKMAKERYEARLQRQKLISVAKEQAEQISILQAEVERLRMKTYPDLPPL
ncbi:cilia- and flagella-associated protein 43 [Tachyglossus aculeatus]|uniref:cilia- and flagella-associated protein 43 n=1 Tax=Tachyglossus aculeatus TaxID=9261 RepID=UPI0018F7874F|nr:cilia- and flagella-associated protein 43 [Tachyglossus aculeatus]